MKKTESTKGTIVKHLLSVQELVSLKDVDFTKSEFIISDYEKYPLTEKQADLFIKERLENLLEAINTHVFIVLVVFENLPIGQKKKLRKIKNNLVQILELNTLSICDFSRIAPEIKLPINENHVNEFMIDRVKIWFQWHQYEIKKALSYFRIEIELLNTFGKLTSEMTKEERKEARELINREKRKLI
ncbi:MAG: hypothetical protein JXR68_14250 [Bacteroidales bacterium]|nr:hypothetical protein [Bacteroidales bacterium]